MNQPSSPPPRPDPYFEALWRAAAEMVARYYPSELPVLVTVKLTNGEVYRLPVPDHQRRPAPQ